MMIMQHFEIVAKQKYLHISAMTQQSPLSIEKIPLKTLAEDCVGIMMKKALERQLSVFRYC